MARPKSEQANTAAVLEVMEVTGALKGKTFSITGHLGLPRPKVVQIIQQAGGHFEERPRWGVNYLVTNRDWNANSTKGKVSSKYEEARRMGIKIITEDELYALIVDNDPSAVKETSK